MTTLPAGKYVIGDPLFVLTDDNYKKLINAKLELGDENQLSVTFKTRINNGGNVFEASDNSCIPVSSGAVGAYSTRLCCDEKLFYAIREGSVLEFNTEFEFDSSIDDTGEVSISGFVIDTSKDF